MRTRKVRLDILQEGCSMKTKNYIRLAALLFVIGLLAGFCISYAVEPAPTVHTEELMSKAGARA